MSEKNPSLCQPGKHTYEKHENTIYCRWCGDRKTLSSSPKEKGDPNEAARKYLFDYGEIKDREKAKHMIKKLLNKLQSDEYIPPGDMSLDLLEIHAMFIAIILISPLDTYTLKSVPLYPEKLLMERVDFHLQFFRNAARFDIVEMKYDPNNNSYSVLMKDAKKANILIVTPFLPETPEDRFKRARDFLIPLLEEEKKETENEMIVPKHDISPEEILELVLMEEKIGMKKCQTLPAVIALRLVSGRKRETEIVLANYQDFKRFLRYVYSYLDYFKESEEFGWVVKEDLGLMSDTFTIAVTKTGETASLRIKCSSLDTFDQAVSYLASFPSVSVEHDCVDKIREAFRVGSDCSTGCQNPVIMALLMVSQSSTHYTIKFETKEAALKFTKEVHATLVCFRESPDFAWEESGRDGDGFFIGIKMFRSKQLATLSVKYSQSEDGPLPKFDRAIAHLKTQCPPSLIVQMIRSDLIACNFNPCRFPDILGRLKEKRSCDESVMICIVATVLISQLPSMLFMHVEESETFLAKVYEFMKIFQSSEEFAWFDLCTYFPGGNITIMNKNTHKVANLKIVSREIYHNTTLFVHCNSL